MALIEGPDKQFLYLSDHHTFGRLKEKVDTLIDDRYVSRIHAVIQWQQPDWKIRDLSSSNGTWVNNTPIQQNKPVALHLNDTIQFGSNKARPFRLIDDSPPQDALVNSDSSEGDKPDIIYLQSYHFLHDDVTPEVVVYRKNHLWYVDNLNEPSEPSQFISDGSLVCISNKIWRLRLVNNASQTIQLEASEKPLHDIRVIFSISLDEEHCNIVVLQNQHTFDLATSSHHLLTLMLARYRAEDIANNLPVEGQGWVYLDKLCKDTGLEERHINIQIHRARKQISEKLQCTANTEALIERRRGQVRFGFASFQILKGGQFEFPQQDHDKNHKT